MEPVPGLSAASIEEDDEYIIPVDVGAVPEPKKTELTWATNDSMPEDVTIVNESDDDRPLMNLAGLLTKKTNDGKGVTFTEKRQH